MRILNRGEIAQQCNEEATPADAPHYNVKIKSIVKDDTIYVESEHCTLKPQEMALIITDRIAITTTQIGFLYPKREDYMNGLWVVEPDNVHPGYSGHLRVHVVNMSNLGITLKAGDKILELIVFENEADFGKFPYSEKSYNEVERISLDEEKRIPKTFLNIKGHDKEIQSLLFTRGMKIGGWIITGLVGFLTILNIISYFNVNKLVSKAYDLEKIDLSREIDKLNARIRQLEEKP